MFQFKDFVGNKKSLLYFYYLSLQKVQLGYYEKIKIVDILPITQMFNRVSLFFQDFIAPFFIFLQTKYELQYNSIDSALSPNRIELNSSVQNQFFGKITSKTDFIIIFEKNNCKLEIKNSSKQNSIQFVIN